MANKEPRRSLLGDLAKDLAEGLAHPAESTSLPSAVAHVGPPPSSAVRDAEVTFVASPEAMAHAEAILAAAGLISGAARRWSLVRDDEHAEVIDTVTVGRDPAVVTFAVRDLLVSRRHCAIAVRDGRLLVADLGSTNGLVVRRGDERIAIAPNGRGELLHGDEVTVNDAVTLFRAVAS